MSEPIDIDYVHRFPHRYWFSTWTTDEEHPEGVRYKLFSARPEASGPIELVVAAEDRTAKFTVVDRTSVSASNFEKTVAVYVDGLSDSLGVSFFAIDLSRQRTPADTMRILVDAGWYTLR
jgi:hypothetical protein